MNVSVTDDEVYAYQEIYKHIEPMIESNTGSIIIDGCINEVSSKYGITPYRFEELYTYDIAQRIAEMKVGVTLTLENNYYINDLKKFLEIPKLRVGDKLF